MAITLTTYHTGVLHTCRYTNTDKFLKRSGTFVNKKRLQKYFLEKKIFIVNKQQNRQKTSTCYIHHT